MAEKMKSNNNDTFVSGLQEACDRAESGDEVGLLAIEMAIKKRARKDDLQFYQPGIAVRSAEEIENAPELIFEMAANNQILKNTERAGNLIVALVEGHGRDNVGPVARTVMRDHGLNQGLSIILMYNQIIHAVKLRK